MTTLTSSSAPAHAELHLQSTRVHFRNIMVATDFSENSLKGLRIAVGAARRFSAKIFLVHVAQPAVYAADLSMAPAALERSLQGARDAMTDWAKHPQLSGLKHFEAVLEGALVPELQRFVDHNHIDLAVVGTSARRGMERLFMGSAAESIVRHLSCPVMIAGPHAGAAPVQYRSIVLATSLKPTSLRAAQYAVALAEELDARLTLLHVGASTEGERFDERTRKEIYERLRSLLPMDSECWCRPKVRFEVGDPAKQILASAEQDDADLIVMSSHEDPIFSDHAPWAVLAKVVRDAKSPVLAVRAHFA